MRNQTHLTVAVSSAGAGPFSEVRDRRPHSASERDATTPGRWSEPAIPTTHRRRGIATSPVGKRNCPNCGDTWPFSEFVLWDDETARERDYATRRWCGECLVKHGHITQARLTRFRDQARAAQAAASPAVQEVVREHRITVQLVDRAMSDPTYEAAILRAARSLQVRATA